MKKLLMLAIVVTCFAGVANAGAVPNSPLGTFVVNGEVKDGDNKVVSGNNPTLLLGPQQGDESQLCMSVCLATTRNLDQCFIECGIEKKVDDGIFEG